MAYRFNHKESISDGIYRIVKEQTELAAHCLHADDDDIRHDVHNARKCFKKIRCIIRLMRDNLGSDIYQYENYYFRNIGRQLSIIRDAEVQVHTWDRLMELYPNMGPMSQQLAIKEFLQLRHQHITQDEHNLPKRAIQISNELRHAPKRIKAWPLSRSGFKALRYGLKRSYRKGNQARKKAMQEPSEENLHEWRKQAKDYWYHSRLLQMSRPGVISKRIIELKTLTELLGDDHDLAVLQQTLTLEVDQFNGDISFAIINARKYQTKLRKKAYKLGQKLYKKSPASYMKKIKKQWQAWQKSS